MIAAGRVDLAFTSGLLAVINPCGFALLPTYLLYFLGMENLRPGTERSSVRRGLLVGAAVSVGFLTVFVIIGVLTKWSTRWFLEKSPWVSLAIGIALVVLGLAMIAGYRLPFTTPKLDVRTNDRTVRSMYVFGVGYAVASIGCAIGPFVSVVLGGFNTDGWATGLTSIAMYGLGFGVLVTGLTVTLAMANTAVLGVLRRGMQWFEYLAGAFVLITGLYLTWYWYSDLRDRLDDRVVTKALDWQQRLENFVDAHQPVIVTVACIVIAGGIGLSLTARVRRSQR